MADDGVPDLSARRRRRSDRARQVADLLRHQFPAGSSLPKEEVLAGEFGASRNTVREALALLRAEGLVERVPGVGTTMAGGKVPHGLHQLMGLAETLHEHGEITNEVRAVALLRPPPVVARRLGVAADESTVYLERIRRLNGVPVSLDLTYLPRDIGEPLLSEDLARRDVFGLIERIAGQPLGHAELTVEAVNADPHSAALLECGDRAALLMVERLTHLADGRPVDLEWVRFRGDRLVMRGELRRGLAGRLARGA